MSVIYNPFDDRIAPQTLIGTESICTRYVNVVSTSSLTLAQLFRQDFPVEAFQQVGRVLRLSICGQFLGNVAVDTKEVVVTFNGIDVFNVGLLSINNETYSLQIEIQYVLSGMGSPIINSRALNTIAGVGGDTTPTFHSYAQNAVSFNPNAAQNFIVSARVQNAANSVSLQRIVGTLL